MEHAGSTATLDRANNVARLRTFNMTFSLESETDARAVPDRGKWEGPVTVQTVASALGCSGNSIVKPNGYPTGAASWSGNPGARSARSRPSHAARRSPACAANV